MQGARQEGEPGAGAWSEQRRAFSGLVPGRLVLCSMATGAQEIASGPASAALVGAARESQSPGRAALPPSSSSRHGAGRGGGGRYECLRAVQRQPLAP